MGGGVSGQWRQWVLFANSVKFGVKDPQFHKDIGFYVFRLPFLQFAVGWSFAALLVVLIVTAVFHYVNGGIRLQSPFQRVTPQVKVHLSVILALMALTKTVQYYLARYELLFSHRGVVDGAGYTDIKAQLPALNFLMIISIAAAVLFAVPQLALAQAGGAGQNNQFCLKRGSSAPSCMYQTMAACNQAKGSDTTAQCMSKSQADQTTGSGSTNPSSRTTTPPAPAPR
jgi:hypothetical protein